MSGTSPQAIAPGLSRRLAAFVRNSQWNDVPEPVCEHALRALFNGFGTALGGSSDQAILRLAASLAPFSAGSAATVVGHGAKRDAPTAAFLNAASMNVFDFDDTHQGTIIHPTAPVAPVVLALAELRPVSGTELLHAFVLGVEVTCRIGNAISPGHYNRGWHITSTCGIFGAAVAAAKLLDLTEEEILWAFGNASAQASGLVETLGFMAKSVGVGTAARGGLLAALMAKGGVEGPPMPLEGPRGFLKVLCHAPKPELIERELGSDWENLRNMFKPYPCGVVLNPVIDACLDLHRKPDFSADLVSDITVRGCPLLKARADRPDVTTGREAQVSAQHAVAVALLRGTAGAADFSDAAVNDPDVKALRAKVRPIETDEAIPVEAAYVSVRCSDGAHFEVRELAATGSPARPMTDAALRDKFAALAEYGSPAIDAGALADSLWALRDVSDVGSIMALARPKA
ncbi:MULTISPECIES: MmgE/PrpD family protein [unclassified Mesorhizobium]|uniref:MmgE/PrpD family protein n=2 Tax=Mesorhizobium TaxID=68287 RepID=UPI000F756394|nr:MULTISPECIES: MmgE/PrpD family protein [unclassified Mesorhizobium]AZO03023.1 MmgE/PrpD family protein [Mesorhizobium sp. M2A.F.Ca.ET.043.02.1.1]RUW42804.1 MmgE/PrpD family protein [Mesorhizobium sp. M2A.F.Ca.ET.015.02.1.1]RVC96923.1 MmgE/PrpD family protein [Mesorhizobium sp. M2A.F.Ca.ET.017.03.2.1]RVC98588.1 MmgE/PrpD family protein [Mesorhizobium sp. M2A.F.Ca.ET.029.05.1.1]RWB41669.1 MAG: MmgE/PrpD family protein [Mesorhizobium sp.]